MLAFALIPTILTLIPLGLYIRSWGRGMFLLLMVLMFPLATTELATDAWIKDLMTPVMTRNFGIDGGWVLVYTSLIMMLLRLNVGPLVAKIGPLGLMIVSSFAAAIGLLFIGNSVGIWILVAATIYAIGQTFFWPTMLGIVGERFPKGGALTLNSVSAVGMLGVGILGTPLLGLLQDRNINAQLQQQAPSVYQEVVTAEKRSIYGTYKTLDPANVEKMKQELEQTTVAIQLVQQADQQADSAVVDPSAAVTSKKLEELKQQHTAIAQQLSLIDRLRADAKRYALTSVAVVPFVMGICYVVLLLWFRSKGGYAVVVLSKSEV